MKINHLKIAGYRGFQEEVSIDLHPNVNVFVGQNGSGKTSILNAISVGLKYLAAMATPRKKIRIGELVKAHDVNYKAESYEILIGLSFKDGLTDLIFKPSSITSNGSYSKLEEVLEEYTPVLLYYPTNRLFTGRRFTNKRTSNIEKELYKNALDNQIQGFSDFEQWFIDSENKENRIRLRENPEFRLPELEPVRLAIKLFFKHLHAVATYEGPFVDDVNKKPKLFMKKGDVSLQLNHLSDGEKMLLLLVSDIARRLLLSDVKAISSDILALSGIVLIDEIELHLHPAWQRKVIPALTKVFPNIQFIITTHSPQVISSLKRENLHIIEDFKLVRKLPPVYGEDSNTILWELFGVKKKPEFSEKAFSKFYKSLENGEDEAKQVLNDLEETYGKDHLEVKKAQNDFNFEFDK